MNASICIIGSEITKGIISDSHASMISHELTLLGIRVTRITIFPDDFSIEERLRDEIEHNDIVIVTGGLGPTQDDITRRAISDAVGRPLVRNEEALQWLKEKLKERAEGSNLSQADFPEGFSFIDNPNGTAPGFYGYKGSTLVVSLPGPPRELRPMFYSSVLPILRDISKGASLECDEYTSFLTPEAKLEDLFEEEDHRISFATRFQDYRISLYVSGGDRELRDRAVESLRNRLGKMRIVDGDVSAKDMLFEALKREGKTIAFAESCTGGLLSSEFASISGVSEVYMGSVTSYSYSAKESVLSVSRDTIERYGAVSEETAREMAEGAKRLFSSDYAISVTGVAGPSLQEGKRVGHISFGFSSDSSTQTLTLEMGSFSRDGVRRRALTAAFLLMVSYIDGDDVGSIASSWRYL